MNKRKHKKLTVNQLREANNYLSMRCRSLKREIIEVHTGAAEHYMLTNAVICAVCAANGGEGIYVSQEDISRFMVEKKVLIEDDGKGFNIKVEDVPCTNEDEASTET